MDEFDDSGCPPECIRTGYCVMACGPSIPLEDDDDEQE